MGRRLGGGSEARIFGRRVIPGMRGGLFFVPFSCDLQLYEGRSRIGIAKENRKAGGRNMKRRVYSVLLSAVLSAGMAFGSIVAPAFAAETEAVSEDAQKGGIVEELRIGITKDIEPRSLASEQGQFGRMNYNAFCAGTMLTRDQNNEIQPNLMTDWEIQDDGSTILATFATDQGITWHDGEPFTIDDVIFSVDYMNNVMASGYLSKVESVEKVSDTQVKMHVKDKAAYFTLGNSAVFVRIFPKHIWENIDDPSNYTGDDATIGCGPYKLVDVDEDARTMTYEAVGDTYLGKELTVKKVVVRTYDSQDALVMAVTTGEVDAMYDYSNPISATMLASISGVENVDSGKSTNLGLFEILFGFNKQPTDDVEFRKAVSLSLDYELLASTIGGEDGEIPGAGILTPASIGFDDSIAKLYQDTDEAQAVLEEAGYKDVDGDGYREMPDGSEMNVLVTPQYNQTKAALYQRLSEIVIDNLDAIGVKCTLDEECVRNAEAEEKLRKEGAYEIYIGYATQGVAYYKTAFLYMFDDPISMWGTCSLEDFTAAYNHLLNATGEEDYAAAAKELQQVNVKELVGVPLCWDKAYYPYRTDKYTGWVNYPGWGVINPDTWYNLRTIEE